MPSEFVTVAKIDELPPGARKLCSLGAHRIAIFNIAGQLHAVENRCPHRGGPIGAGQLDDQTLSCPWHGHRFDLPSGQCLQGSRDSALKHYPVRVQDDLIQVDLEAAAAASPDGIHRYLVRYGSLGFVGRFGTVHRVACRRGELVIVHTDRGVEIGEVLALPDQRGGQGQPSSPTGELVRLMTDEDQRCRQQQSQRHLPILERCRKIFAARRIPAVAVEAELLFDEQTVIIYYLGQASRRLGQIAAQLAGVEPGVRVQFQAADETGAAAASPAGETAKPPSEKETPAVKGPYERLRYDLRRVWECPVCNHRERTGGDTTFQLCQCQIKEPPRQRVYMRLIEDGFRRTDQQVRHRPSSLPAIQVDPAPPSTPPQIL